MATFGRFMFSILVGFAGILLWALVLQCAWSWFFIRFLTEALKYPVASISFGTAVCGAMVLRILKLPQVTLPEVQAAQKAKEESNSVIFPVVAFFNATLVPLATLFTCWVIHFFV